MPFKTIDGFRVWECDACHKIILPRQYTDIEFHAFRHFFNPVGGLMRFLFPWYGTAISWIMLLIYLMR